MGNYIEPEDVDMVYGLRITSVGPGRVTGSNSTYEPTNLDLAMKLHYHRAVYLFESKAVEECGLTLARLKAASFTWLTYYYESCGRFRRSEETGRPYIKCNDCGIRFIEAKSSKTVQEWVQLNQKDASRLSLLVPSQVLGPELTFSPPVFIQVTNLKCGGLALGLGFSHVLGDFFSVSEFMNYWAKILSGYKPKNLPNLNKLTAHEPKCSISSGPVAFSLKKVDPVGDHWVVNCPSNMETFSFHLSPPQLVGLRTQVSCPNGLSPSPCFETLCGVIWQAVAKAQYGNESPKRVTIIREDNSPKKEMIRNTQVISVVQADFEVKDTHPKILAQLIRDKAVDERARISKTIENDPATSDFLVYGSNLTFVNLEGVDCYGFMVKGHKPCLVNYVVDVVGEEGAVFVLPGPTEFERLVTMMLPESVMLKVKQQLVKEGFMGCAYE
ncbi:hypothetical protein V2J09_024047 [Rumex salicifolius]